MEIGIELRVVIVPEELISVFKVIGKPQRIGQIWVNFIWYHPSNPDRPCILPREKGHSTFAIQVYMHIHAHTCNTDNHACIPYFLSIF